MILLFIEYSIEITRALKVCDGFDALLINPPVINSWQELQLSEFLAKKSFADGNNIADKFKYEFLLWLTGKRDIKSSMIVSEPKEKTAFLIFFRSKEKNDLIKFLSAKEIAFNLKKEA